MRSGLSRVVYTLLCDKLQTVWLVCMTVIRFLLILTLQLSLEISHVPFSFNT